ncbi:MAG: hypothetical protein M3O30_01770 [Planctomycetota bacterium]|nr:hypothetical protein [Planctomycetota bacterium]
MRWLAVLVVLCLVLSACAARHPATTPSILCDSPRYLVSGGVANSGPRALSDHETVASVIDKNLPRPLGHSATVILVRAGPDGRTRQFIQLNGEGKLMNEEQNVSLRNGDELIFPWP